LKASGAPRITGQSKKSFHRSRPQIWRQSFAGAQHSKFHFIDDFATAPHHLSVDLKRRAIAKRTITLKQLVRL
jgi:hypothetical protein